MTRLARETFPPGRVGDTVKVRVPDVDRRRCDSRNILGVITEVDPNKDMYKIGTNVGVLNTWYTRNQFSTCTEEIIDVDDVPTNEISLIESAGKMSLSGGQAYKICTFKAACRTKTCSCRKS